MQIEFSDKEREAIVEALESTVSDLRAEIADTDRLEFRNTLKLKRDALAKLLAAIRADG